MRKSTTRQFESRLPRAVSDHRCEITGVKFLPGLPSRCVYIDLEEKTLHPLQNPFGPKVYTYVSGTFCYPCLRNGHLERWCPGTELNRRRQPFQTLNNKHFQQLRSRGRLPKCSEMHTSPIIC